MAKKNKFKGKKKKGIPPYDPWYHPTTIMRVIPKPLDYKSASGRMFEIFAKALLITLVICSIIFSLILMGAHALPDSSTTQNDNTHDTEYTSVQCQGGEN